MHEKVYYDLHVQEIVGSIIASSIFYLIRNRIEFEFGKMYPEIPGASTPGACITHAQIAHHLGIKKSEVQHAIKKLKDNNFILMDYVNLDMFRAPVFFLTESAKALDFGTYQIRCYDKMTYAIVKCYQTATLHHHVYHLNVRNDSPLTQTFGSMGRSLGLTIDQIKRSYWKLVENDLLFSEMGPIGIYISTAKFGGVSCLSVPQQTVLSESPIASNAFTVPFSKKTPAVLSESDDTSTLNNQVRKYGEAKTPPALQNVFLKEEGFVVRGSLRISVSDWDFVISSSSSMHLVELGVLKYNEDWELRRHTLNSGSVKGDLMRCIRFSKQNVLAGSMKEQEERNIAEDNRKREEDFIQQQKKAKENAEQQKICNLSKEKQEFLSTIPESENMSELAREAIYAIIKEGNDIKCKLTPFEDIYKYRTKKLSTDEKQTVDRLTAYQSLKSSKKEQQYGNERSKS